MTIHYEITAFHTSTGSVQVKFYNDEIPEGIIFLVNVNKVDGRYPVGDALDALIRSHAPKDIFERAVMLRDVPPPLIEVKHSGHQSPFPVSASTEDGIVAVLGGGKEQAFIPQPLFFRGSLEMPIEVI